MLSILLKASHAGLIMDVLWSQPVYLLSDEPAALHDLFAEGQRDRINSLLRQAQPNAGMHRSIHQLQLRNPDITVSCYVLADQNHILMLVCQLDCPLVSGPQGELLEHFQSIVHHFMEAILYRFGSELKSKDPLTRDHFDQIQLLNNELVNTHRKLQKVNAQLNRLNEILNNRLVKDPLTGLVSRYQYQAEIEQLIEQSADSLGIFLFIDIDNFKGINDKYGHPIGDAYLVEFAERLRRLELPGERICMRISGDEFGIYIHNLSPVDADLYDAIWKQFLEHVTGPPIVVEGLKLPVSCSVGMAIYGQDTKQIYELIEYADFAMYEAKNSGKCSYRTFNRETFDHDRKIKSEIRHPDAGDSGHDPVDQSGIV